MASGSRRTFIRNVAVAAPAAALAGSLSPGSAAEPNPSWTPLAIEPGPNYSRAMVYGGVAHVAGVLGVKPGTRELASADFEGQCRQGLENLKSSVEAAGSRLDRVLKCTCFLTEATDFATMNKVYATFFPRNPPARSTVVVKALVMDGAKFEIDCVAAVV